MNQCLKLNTLFISNNRIKNWDEIGKLHNLPELKNVLFIGNPVYGDMSDFEVYAPYVVKKLPNIEQVDSKMISAGIRKTAEDME